MIPEQSQVEGCLLGLALGDACCAPYEGGLASRALWAVIGRSRGKRRWTDDTRMSLDLAECLIENGTVNQAELARRFAASYRWSRGYGPGAAKLLKRIRQGQDWPAASRSVYQEGSYGNGAAMRAPIIGIAFAANLTRLRLAARQSAEITHAHPLGLAGAELMALAIALAVNTVDTASLLEQLQAASDHQAFRQRLQTAALWLGDQQDRNAAEVREQLGNGMSAPTSVVTAIYIGLRFASTDFKEVLSFVRGCGGDTDTIAAMAGALWGAINGAAALPADQLAELEAATLIRQTAVRLYDRLTGNAM